MYLLLHILAGRSVTDYAVVVCIAFHTQCTEGAAHCLCSRVVAQFHHYDIVFVGIYTVHTHHTVLGTASVAYQMRTTHPAQHFLGIAAVYTQHIRCPTCVGTHTQHMGAVLALHIYLIHPLIVVVISGLTGNDLLSIWLPDRWQRLSADLSACGRHAGSRCCCRSARPDMYGTGYSTRSSGGRPPS